MGKMYQALWPLAVAGCLLLSGCGTGAVQAPQETAPPAQVERQEVRNTQAPPPAQNGAEESAPPAESETPPEAPVLESQALPAFVGRYCLQWEVMEEPLIYNEQPVGRTSTRLMALENGQLRPLEFPNDQALRDFGLPSETLSQLELVSISPDAVTLVYRQPIAFSEPDRAEVCVPYIFRYYIFSGGRVQTFDLELNPYDWEWAYMVVQFDWDVRGCLITHFGPEESRTYTHIDFNTMEATLLTETGMFSSNPEELIYQVVCNGSKAYACTLSGRDPVIRVVSMPEREVILTYPLQSGSACLYTLRDEYVTFTDDDGAWKALSLETGEAAALPPPDSALDPALRNVLYSEDRSMAAGAVQGDTGNVITVYDVQSGASMRLEVPWQWQLTGILPKSPVEAYLRDSS